jgi:hypothetical protein
MHHDQQMLSSFDLVRMSQLTAHQRRGFIVFVSSQARLHTPPQTHGARASADRRRPRGHLFECRLDRRPCVYQRNGRLSRLWRGRPVLNVRASQRGMLFERTAGVMRLTVG